MTTTDEEKIQIFENLKDIPDLKDFLNETCFAQTMNGY